MSDSKKADAVRALFEAFMSKDRKRADALLSEDFTFTSPYDDAIDKTAYFERCFPNSEHMRALDIERVAVDGDGAFAMYRATTTDGKEFRNTEFFELDGDRIRGVNVFFGATYKDGVFVKDEPA